MSLATPASVQKLQTALHAKAKESPGYRFYALYDKVYRKDVLICAYDCCKANGGAAGVDGQGFEDIEAYGVERWLDELAQELKNRTYQPLPVRRVYIPKPDGKQRPLGVPAIRDRTAEMAAVLVLDPIFEADLQPEQYAYRRDRSALDAVNRVRELIYAGHQEIVDADLTSYFDSIPHAELLKSVARRVVDGAMLHLIKMWLEAPVEETDEHGNKHRSTRNRDDGRGTPQGAPISPLLSNLYMRRFVLGWKKLGHEKRLQAYIINYADDLVICCRASADEALSLMRSMMSRLKLTVNDSKTRVWRLPEEKDQWLGQLLLPGAGQSSLPSSGATHLPAVSPVAVCQTQRAGTGKHAVSPEGSASKVWPGSTYQPDRQFSVGDSVNLSPRAGCVNRACPVR
jgi:group II intron reverse transcriptase/maturase